jgi:hypothetical protein
MITSFRPVPESSSYSVVFCFDDFGTSSKGMHVTSASELVTKFKVFYQFVYINLKYELNGKRLSLLGYVDTNIKVKVGKAKARVYVIKKFFKLFAG